MFRPIFKRGNAVVFFLFVLLVPFLYQPHSFFFERLKVGDVSDRSYYATQDMKYIDQVATEQARKEKEDSIEPIYKKNESVEQEMMDQVKSFFSSVKEFKTKSEELNASINALPNNDANQNLIKELDQQKKNLSSGIKNPFDLKPEEITEITKMKADDIQRLQEMFVRELHRLYRGSITDKDLALKQSELINNANFYYFFSDATVSPLLQHVSAKMKPNFLFDAEQTKLAKQKARGSVEEMYKAVKKGERIVATGEVLDAGQYQKIEQLGLNKQFTKDTWFTYAPFVLLIATLMYACFYVYAKNIFFNFRHFAFMYSSVAIVLGVHNFVKDTSFSFLSFIPAFCLLYLVHIFWKRHVMLLMSLFSGILMCMGDFLSLTVMIFSGVYLFVTFPKRFKIKDMFFSSIFLGITLVVTDIILYYTVESDIHFDASFAYFPSVFIGSLFAVGFIPILEKTLDMVTSIRLYELTDDDHPLLVRLLREADGTYTHSVMVRNLCEIAADAIGNIDKLLLRVGAMFHDVGKLKNPSLFSENVRSEASPHDDMDPIESAQVIRAHVQDGLDLCRKHNVPNSIIRLIESHHGDALLYQFYQKAKQENPDVTEEQFRYPHPAPKTKEQGILMLADSVEAYSRRLMKKPKEEILSCIEKFIYDKMTQGILSNCDLTICEIEKIKDAFLHHYSNLVHERTAYPKRKNS
ncbi:HD family phosphohydrolase [Bacillus luti]|nr:HDIG domain-containing protein [Bacillus cereus]HDR8327626.1 HDIG domain-containing protein [Bacillus cereus]HDR8334335.1 HDIG domain-containing protein [Bacillus cereus]